MALSDFLLNGSVTVERKTPSRDSSGAARENYAAVSGLAELPASIQPLSGEAIRFHMQRQVILSHTIFVDADYGIRRGDRLLDDATGRYFLVHGVENQAGRDLVWAVSCKEET